MPSRPVQVPDLAGAWRWVLPWRNINPALEGFGHAENGSGKGCECSSLIELC